MGVRREKEIDCCVVAGMDPDLLLVATTGFGQSKDYERFAEAGIDYIS
jgi:hypothetical protein